jgi:signal transduction histidine kinase
MLSILIVDDELMTCEALHTLLKKSFFPSVYTAADAAHALKIIKERNIDIVLMDIRLPDIDGLDLTQDIRSRDPDIEIIIITGYGSQDIAVQSLRKGAIDYIEKPVRMENLLAAIGRAEERLIVKKKSADKKVILVAAAEEDTTKWLKDALCTYGYDIITAGSGKEAWTSLEANRVDVFVFDIELQDGDGREIFNKAKKLQPDLEGIVIASPGNNELIAQTLRAGVFDYIQKPLDLALLQIKIEKALEKIKLSKSSTYRNRELRITSEIITRVNEELEKRIEERSQELFQTQAQLFQTSKLATLGEMSAGLAHELNQPLGAIALTTKYLNRMLGCSQLDNEELLKAIHDIDYSIKRMTSVIQHIRTFARQDTLKFVEVDINETVEAALNLLGEQLRLHEIDIVKNLSPALPCIAGEPFQLEQVWLNLLVNARDAIEEKASQLKQAALADEAAAFKKCLHIATGYEDNQVFFLIEDNGRGMSEEVKNKIFEPFFTTKEVGQALGLGMSISYGILKSHNGKIEVESREGEGTIIRVSFAPFKETLCQKS